MEPERPTAGRQRIDSIDLLRGVVIVLMALDHVRDFFGPFPYPPEDLTQASVALFLTRWVTHFCAPVFVLLAGVGAYLYGARHGRRALVRFLLTRGVWLIVLELVWINLAWLSYFQGWGFVQVLWALGWSMIALAALIWLPRWLLATLALGMIAGHNLFDGVQARELAAPWSYLWMVLHQQQWFSIGSSFGFMTTYPLIPWPAVMAVGYLLGPLFRGHAGQRRTALLRYGGAAIVGFFVLRALNGYGDPGPWTVNERGPLFTVLSFLNTAKYPPSLLFLLMTLGPALVFLPFVEQARNRLARFFVLFGRVPLFFYLIHFVVIHLLAAGYSQLRYGAVEWWVRGPQNWPAAYEPALWLVYVVWALVVAGLYPLCVWFAGIKRRHQNWWLRYL